MYLHRGDGEGAGKENFGRRVHDMTSPPMERAMFTLGDSEEVEEEEEEEEEVTVGEDEEEDCGVTAAQSSSASAAAFGPSAVKEEKERLVRKAKSTLSAGECCICACVCVPSFID